MTIKLLVAIQGSGGVEIPAGTEVTLSDAVEAAHVSANKAVYTTRPMTFDALPSSAFNVKVYSGPGVVKNQIPGKTILPLGPTNRRQALIKPLGATAISGTATVTRHAAFVLPGMAWKAYKVRLFNAHTADVTYSVGVTTQNAIGDAIYNSASWEIPTFSGSSSVAAPAGSGTVPNQAFGTIDSDLMFTPSADYNGGTIIGLRTYCATANNTRFDVSSGFLASLGAHGMYSGYITSGDAVSTPGNFTSPTAHASMPPVALIAYTEKQIRRIALFGSSTISGSNDTANIGWSWRTQNALSTGEKAYQFVNFAQPSATTAANFSRAMALLGSGAFDTAVYSVYSTNDSDRTTAAGLNRIRGQMHVFIDECLRLGIEPKLATFQYITGMTGQDYINCKAINNEARILAASGLCGIFDIAGLFSDENSATGTWKDPSNTSDGTHPNALGTAVLVPYAESVFA